MILTCVALSNVGVGPVIFAQRIIDFAKLVAAVNWVAEVLVCQILPISYACRFQRPSFCGKPYADCPPAPCSFLAAPRHACQLAAIFWSVGVHFNDAGMRKYVRSIRGVAMFFANRF